MDYLLFDRVTSTKLNLLYLLFQNGDWYRIDELIANSQLDRGTLMNYISNIQNDIDSITTISTPLIVISKGNGIKFLGDKMSYRIVIHSLIEASISFSLMKEFFFKPSVSIDIFANDHFVSESSLRRLIVKLNTFYKKYGFNFHSKNRQLTFKGSEVSFRYYSYQMFWFIYRGLEWPFPIINEEKILTFIEQNFLAHSSLKDISITKWSYILSVNITRFNLGCSIRDSDLPYFSEELNQTIIQQNSTILTAFKEAFFLSKAEINFIALTFQIETSFYLTNHSTEKILEFHQTHNTPIYQMYELLLDDPLFSMSEITSEKQKVVKSLILAVFLSASLFPSFETNIAGYDYSKYLKKNFPYFYERMVIKLHSMRKKTDSSLLNNEEFLIPRLAEIYALIGKPTDFDPKIFIKLETDLPIGMESVLANQLTSAFDSFFNVEIISPLSPDSTVAIDLIIATVASKTLAKKWKKRIVCINPEFRSFDFYNVAIEIEKIRFEKQ